MARPSKLTKFSAENALLRTRSVSGAAAYSGVDRRTFQRAMRRFGIVLATESDGFSALFEGNAPDVTKPAQTTEAVAVAAKAVDPQPKPEKSALRLSAADFSGPNLGEVRPSFPDQRVMLDRYRRLKGY